MCPVCHQEIPKGKNKAPLLHCPHCLAAKSYQAVLQFQRQFVGRMRKGESEMTLSKPANELRWHLVLAQYEQAWCGRTVNTRWNRKHLKYPKIDATTPLCPACQQVFEGLAEDVPAEVA